MKYSSSTPIGITSSPRAVASANGGIGDSRKLFGISDTSTDSDFFSTSVWNHFSATYPLSSVETTQKAHEDDVHDPEDRRSRGPRGRGTAR